MPKRGEERDGAEGGVGAWDKALQKDAPRPVREVFSGGKRKADQAGEDMVRWL